jgi:hypothetical protein
MQEYPNMPGGQVDGAREGLIEHVDAILFADTRQDKESS